MKPLNFTKIIILNVFTINCARADINRALFKSDEEINKPYIGYPEVLESQGANAQRRYLKEYEQSIIESKKLPPDQAIEILGRNLTKVSEGFQVAEKFATYDKLQSALLAIPGYGDYYLERIEQSRVKSKAAGAQPDEVSSYGKNRGFIFGVLPELPGPETIKLLGHYLYDLRDPPIKINLGIIDPIENSIDHHKDPSFLSKENDRYWTIVSTNSFRSALVLSKIGLRNSPTDKFENIDINPEESIARSKAWWEKVKAGQIPFSFIGQTVEYRFRPDGTWETTQLPISVLERDKNPAAPAQPRSTVRPERHGLPEPGVLAKTTSENAVSTARRYLLPTSGLLALLLGVWYFLRNRKAV